VFIASKKPFFLVHRSPRHTAPERWSGSGVVQTSDQIDVATIPIEEVAVNPVSSGDDSGSAARADWERRIYRRLTDTSDADPALALPAPPQVVATPGSGFVRLSWNPVAGAAGYLIERCSEGGQPHIVTHGGSDVPAVPGHRFADTGLAADTEYTYRIAAVPGAEDPAWNWSEPVTGHIATGPAGPVAVTVDAGADQGPLHRVWHMVGSERLTQLTFGVDEHGHDIGGEFLEALRLAHDDLGVDRVRAHALLHDDNRVVRRAADGTLAYDFTIVDRLYDSLVGLGIRPVVELSFMPQALAADPDATVFTYRGIISPPSDWAQWRSLVFALASHLVSRYGIDEVCQWGFEVWNEPNLEVFWTGSQEDYFRLYEESAAAIKQVDERLLVGGPSTAAAEWLDALAQYAQKHHLSLDFASSHTYGNAPLDPRPALARHGFADSPIWWTEWGVGSTHFGSIHDAVIGAPFILSGYAAVQGRMDALAYWVISDHFEELGRPPRLFHNGFGLLTVGNLHKPRYWAVQLAAHSGDRVVSSTVAGDGAQVLVQALATRHDDGTIDVLVWNGTVNGELMDGDPRLDRRVVVHVTGLAVVAPFVALARVDATHSNILAGYPEGVDWPDQDLWNRLRKADHLYEEQVEPVTGADGEAAVEFDLPMPGVIRLRFCPDVEGSTDRKDESA
jgi:xylan 1,4-beta-xylosidase